MLAGARFHPSTSVAAVIAYMASEEVPLASSTVQALIRAIREAVASSTAWRSKVSSYLACEVYCLCMCDVV